MVLMASIDDSALHLQIPIFRLLLGREKCEASCDVAPVSPMGTVLGSSKHFFPHYRLPWLNRLI